MASTFSTNLAIELIGTGDQAGTWGTTTNSNLGTLIEQAVSGYVTQAVATGTDTTITIPNGATGVARNMYIELTGTGGTNTNLIVPANKKLYFIFNNSTGAVTVKVSGQTGVSVPTGKKMVLVSNGTDIVNGLNYIADFGTNSFSVTNLTASSATITNLIATSGSITNLVSSDASATVLRAGSATLTHLSATSATITNLTLTSLVISNLSIASANITTLTGSTQTLSGNLTLSGGTANGVLYLNGSKVATSGSALVFDGTNLGIGTASPAQKLTVAGGSVLLDNSYYYYGKNAAGTAVRLLGVNSGNVNYVGSIDSGPTEVNYGAASTITAQYWNISGSEGMRLTSTGLGIGTASPAVKLQVAGAIRSNSSVTGPLANLHTSATNPASTGASGNGLNFGYDSNGEVAWIQANRNDITETRGLLLNPNGGNVGIGTTSPTYKMAVESTGQILLSLNSTNANGGYMALLKSGLATGYFGAANPLTSGSSTDLAVRAENALVFAAGGATERARITSGGAFIVGKTAASFGGTEGFFVANGDSSDVGYAAQGYLTRVSQLNRQGDDGNLVEFFQDSNLEGTISVSGTTVSYNGGHLSRWSQTADNTRISLLKGTVMSNLDQMAAWEKDGQPLPNEQLNCMKVSDVEGDVNVSGVFVNWDNDDDVYTNDMNIAMTGDMIIRIAQSVVVQRGDLLMSAGDGTAKPQGDDIIRSKTVAKVTSNHVTCTYEDGSYCVPCVLMAC